MHEMLRVIIDGKVTEYPKGTPYLEIAKDNQSAYPHDIILVFVNGKLQELHKRLKNDSELRFVTTGTEIGNLTYKRGISFLLVKAIYDVIGHEKIQKVMARFSVSRGYYFTIAGNVNLDEELLEKIEARMHELAEMNLPIMKQKIHTDEAIQKFRQYGMYDKEKLFHYRRVSAVNVYSINEFEDYYYGYMAPSTGYLKYFKLYLYDEGLVVQMPVPENPVEVPEFKPSQKLFQVLKESTTEGGRMGIETVADLNGVVVYHDPQELILVQEALQEKKIAQIANQIASQPEKKFVLIAGPSSSGKTTFSHRLAIQLRVNGLVPHALAVDNYFVDRALAPRDEDGKLDFESIDCVDMKMLNEDLEALLAGKRVEIPRFNFKTGKREYKGDFMELGENDILLLEGIHCLNDRLTYGLPREHKFKIYISALTQLNVDEHNRISSTDGRLLRRMVRDARTRGASAKQTIAMWDSVRRGEEKNIFPYQEEADVMFNSALLYELAVLKPYVEPLLFGIEKDCEEYVEAKRLLKFLDYFVGMGNADIPANSLLREFIGDGCFDI